MRGWGYGHPALWIIAFMAISRATEPGLRVETWPPKAFLGAPITYPAAGGGRRIPVASPRTVILLEACADLGVQPRLRPPRKPPPWAAPGPHIWDLWAWRPDSRAPRAFAQPGGAEARQWTPGQCQRRRRWQCPGDGAPTTTRETAASSLFARRAAPPLFSPLRRECQSHRAPGRQ